MTVSRLERGGEVSLGTVSAAARACGASLAITHLRGWLTAHEHSRAIARELEAGDTTFAVRLVRQAVEDLDYLVERGDQRCVREFFALAPDCGDTAWDGLLTLALSDSCERYGATLPAWSQTDPLPEPFFPTRPSRRFIARTIERTPARFAERNIWIDARDLTYA